MSQQPAKNGESSGNANANANAKPAKGKGKGNKSKGPKPGSKEPEKKEESKKTGPKKSTYVACALLFGDAGPILASHEMLGVDRKISSRMALFINKHCHPYFGVQLTIPRDEGQKVSEYKGFGVCHTYEGHTSLPSDHMITIKFPRGKIACSYDPVPLSVRNKFPAIKEWEKFSYITVKLNDGAFSTIDGYAKPFANPVDRDLEGWVNDNKPMIGGVTMLDMLQQREFFFVLKWAPGPASKNFGDEHVPPPFDYGYPAQPLEYDEMVAMVDGNPGADFFPSYGFSNDHDHMTVVNQANIQDLLWVDRAKTEISMDVQAAYFVTPETGAAIDAKPLYIVIPVTKQWKIAHDAAWRRLTKSELLVLKIYDTITPQGAEYKIATWKAKLLEFPGGVTALEQHPTEDHEIVLRVLCNDDPEVIIRHFSNRSAANAALKEDKQT